MKKLLPLHAMAENFGLVSKSLRSKLGRKSYFTPEGKVALMFLKMYTGLSCPKLKIQKLQDILVEQWKPYMQNLDTMYTDATCYESEMRYPTDPKLLWEGIEKSYETMCEWGKILKEIRKTERAYENAQSLLTTREKSDLEIITKMYRQQKNHFQSKDCRESIPNRIVSISKPYVRPIVRGKEVKSVEFGAIHCLKMHKRLFGVEAKKVGGDSGYAGTDNRDYCKDNGIQTSFVKRGQPFSEDKKEKDLVRKELGQGDGDSDGGLVRHIERALRPEASQGPDEVDGNPVHLLRHTHGKRGAAGR